MKLNNLKPAAGSTHSRRRIGRGPGSGLGGTSTRGHNHKEYFAVNLSTLQKLAESKGYTEIGIDQLVEAGLTNGKELVKVLANGEIKAALTVKANAFSKTAEEAIKAVGGNTVIL